MTEEEKDVSGEVADTTADTTEVHEEDVSPDIADTKAEMKTVAASQNAPRPRERDE